LWRRAAPAILRTKEEGAFMDKPAVIRQATAGDLPVLASLKYGPIMHRDRLRDADGSHLRYLVVDLAGHAVGFGLLVLGQPRNWPPVKHLPQMIDLYVREDLRGRGLETRLISEIERQAVDSGRTQMWVGVDPDANAGALRLYQRLGYEVVDPEPVEDRWEYVDSEGVRHSGVEWIVHLRKPMG
jgi:ribosomal protein S18 acetylase RimI-like enzyme